MIAALYVDSKRGLYPSWVPYGLIDVWDEARDATKYPGPHPVIAHPPCGHWGRYSQKAHDDGHTGPIAVAQVRRWGGVLEHPKDSKLWKICGIPKPGEMPDEWGGYSILVEQGDFGHRAQKPTWLYIVGTREIPPMPPRRPPPADIGRWRGQIEVMPKSQRHLTPRAFAEWLIDLVATVRMR